MGKDKEIKNEEFIYEMYKGLQGEDGDIDLINEFNRELETAIDKYIESQELTGDEAVNTKKTLFELHKAI